MAVSAVGAVRKKKVDLRNSEQLLRVFSFLKEFEKVEKIGYHSNSNFECNTERGFKESLSIALGPGP